MDVKTESETRACTCCQESVVRTQRLVPGETSDTYLLTYLLWPDFAKQQKSNQTLVQPFISPGIIIIIIAKR